MIRTILLCGAALLFAGSAAAKDAAAAPPYAGSYAASIYVYSTNGDNSCIDQQYDVLAGAVSYAGFTKTTDYVRVPVIGGGPIASVQTLRITKGAGTKTPSGNLLWTGTGTGGQLWNVSGTFSGTITEVGTHAFLVEMNEAYSHCTESLDISLVWVSADP